MALAAVAAGAVRIGSMVGKTAIGVTKVAGSTIRSGARVGSRATAKGAKKVNAGLKKAILQRKRVQRTTFLKNQRRKRRDVELQKRNAREQELERRSISKGKRGIKVPTIARNPLQALIEFLSTILIGWLINKLPQIIEWAEKLIEFIKKIVKIIGSFFSNLKDALSSIVDLFKNTAEAIKNFDFTDKDRKIRDSFDKLKESFEKMGKDIEDGKQLLKETTQKSPEEIMSQERSELMSDPEKVKSEIERVRTGETTAAETTPTVQPQTSITGDLFSIITSGEGGVNSVNRSTAGDTLGGAKSIFGKNLTDMTVSEIYAAQQSGRVFAVGKYQIIPDTMTGFINYLRGQGINPDKTKFTEKIQDFYKPYTVNVKRPTVGNYLRGKATIIDANLELAAEFASVGVPYDMKKGSYNGTYPLSDIKKGDSLYSDIGGNKASISPEEIQASLRGSSGGKFLSSLPRAETNLKIDTTSEDIIVIDEQPVPVASTTVRGSSSVILVPVGPSLNSMLRQQLLLDLAYT